MNNLAGNIWGGITTLIGEIKACESAGAVASAVAMAFICIDTMALLSIPEDRPSQTRNDFIAWVDTYLKGHADQPYQYRGIDVYGARCAMLHAFGSQAELHAKYPDVVKFGYHNGGKHMYDPKVDKAFALIGTASFLNDVVHAVLSFTDACQADPELRIRVETRLPHVLSTMPIKQ